MNQSHASQCSTEVGAPDCTTLDHMRTGQRFEVVSVDDEMARVQATRFGMGSGACIECITRIPAGPLVVRSGRQEIAIGRGLAKKIAVRVLEAVR